MTLHDTIQKYIKEDAPFWADVYPELERFLLHFATLIDQKLANHEDSE